MAITIRRMQSGDADELYRLLSDPVVMRYLELPYDRARTEAFLCCAGLAAQPLVYAVEESRHVPDRHTPELPPLHIAEYKTAAPSGSRGMLE